MQRRLTRLGLALFVAGAVTILVGEDALTWLEMDKVSFQVAP